MEELLGAICHELHTLNTILLMEHTSKMADKFSNFNESIAKDMIADELALADDILVDFQATL